MAGPIDHGGPAVMDPPAVTPEDLERLRREVQEEREREMTALRDQLGELATRPDLGPAIEEIREQVAGLGTRITRDLEPHVRNVEGRLDALTADGGVLATLRGDFDTRMRAETAARGSLRTEVLGWVGDRTGLTTTLTQDVGTAQAHATGARGVASIGLIISAVLLVLGGLGLYLTRSDVQEVASLASGIASEMGGLDTSKPAGQQLVGWHQTQDRLESVEGTTLVLADRANKMTRAGETHRDHYNLPEAMTPEQILFGWKDPKTGKWHVGAREQANNAQATAYRIGEAADARAGIDPKESRTDHYALGENPYGDRTGDLENDSDPVKAYRAKRR